MKTIRVHVALSCALTIYAGWADRRCNATAGLGQLRQVDPYLGILEILNHAVRRGVGHFDLCRACLRANRTNIFSLVALAFSICFAALT